MNVTRPSDKMIRGHLCSKDVEKILEKVKPELAIIMHMGMLFLERSPKKETSKIEKKNGIKTIPGYVGTHVSITEAVSVSRPAEQITLGSFKTKK